MTNILLLGLELAEREWPHLSIRISKYVSEAEQLLLQEATDAAIVEERLAAQLMELQVQGGLEGLPVIVVTKDLSPKQVRQWHAYGVHEVWPVSTWQKELLQRYPTSTGSAPEPDDRDQKRTKDKKRRMLPSFSGWTQREEFEDSVPARPKERKPKPIRKMAGTVVIGVSGLMRRTGTSHDAIRLAQTIAGYGHSVACVEVLQNPEAPIQVFTSLMTGEMNDHSDGFKRDGVDYYPNQTLEQSIEIIGSGYKYVVADFGCVLDEQSPPWHRLEFFRSDQCFITIGASPWDFYSFVSWGKSRKGKRKPVSVLVHFADKTTFEHVLRPLKDVQTEMGVTLTSMPLDANLMDVSGLKRSVYSNLLQSVVPDAEPTGRFRPFWGVSANPSRLQNPYGRGGEQF